MTQKTSWQALAAAHRAKQQQAIPAEWTLDAAQLSKLKNAGGPKEGKLVELDVARKSGLLSESELNITENLTAGELVGKLAAQELSSEEVVQAFCKRAGLAQQLTSCLTEIFFEEGLERARYLDKQLKETGKPVGPLHGLPISLKDSYTVEGKHATVGYIEFLRRPIPTTNAPLVKMLLEAGAVLYCKTNLPQTMMTADSENNIFERTLNPHNTNLTAGGSTGGEGALVAFRGSVLGVGSDIAGSIRIPSLCCGIYGFKPTADRVPFGGQAEYPFPKTALPSVIPAAGPMANSVDDLALFMKVVLEQRPWRYDATAVDVPWREGEVTKGGKLVVGVLAEDPDYPLHAPVKRALASAAAALEKAGHKVVHLPADPKTSAGFGARIGFQYFTMMGPPPDVISEQVGEPLVASVARLVHPFTKAPMPVSPELDVPSQYSDLHKVCGDYADSWRQTWIENELDVVLAPGAVSTAVPHDTYGNPVYTLMWNVLNYPAGIIPFGNVSKELDPDFKKATADFDPDYDPEALDGAPCALQIIAPRFRDEECLNAMRIIDKDVRA
ncbi:amidase signature domain-containing protein [Dactylonectria estremocensis]|uniref:Amidase signature domain-containing protein n=1 Tax=Dactylonectria estremocensis TaxID=1079267 RepID=A0A9P9EGN5_9HYPO|nr:amidase signature domain-containing protein [Dactylonectria estremocensis]